MQLVQNVSAPLRVLQDLFAGFLIYFIKKISFIKTRKKIEILLKPENSVIFQVLTWNARDDIWKK